MDLQNWLSKFWLKYGNNPVKITLIENGCKFRKNWIIIKNVMFYFIEMTMK